MIKRLGIEGKLDVLIFLSLILLVAITPLGKEATNPVVLGIYRTLLVLITTLACAARDRDRDELLFEESNGRNPAFDLAAGDLESILFQKLTGRPAKDRRIHERIVAPDSSRMRANPHNSFTRSSLAEAVHNLGRGTEAINELKNCIEIEPNYVQAYLRLAQWEEASGNRDTADGYRQKAIAIVQQYRNQTNLDSLEARLLDRPIENTGKP